MKYSKKGSQNDTIKIFLDTCTIAYRFYPYFLNEKDRLSISPLKINSNAEWYSRFKTETNELIRHFLKLIDIDLLQYSDLPYEELYAFFYEWGAFLNESNRISDNKPDIPYSISNIIRGFDDKFSNFETLYVKSDYGNWKIRECKAYERLGFRSVFEGKTGALECEVYFLSEPKSKKKLCPTCTGIESRRCNSASPHKYKKEDKQIIMEIFIHTIQLYEDGLTLDKARNVIRKEYSGYASSHDRLIRMRTADAFNKAKQMGLQQRKPFILDEESRRKLSKIFENNTVATSATDLPLNRKNSENS